MRSVLITLIKILPLALVLSACGGGGSGSPPTYSVGGTVSGLGAGTQVTLLNGGSNATTVTSNGPFTFSNSIPSSGIYSVTVGTQPVGQNCAISNGVGSGVTANVTNILVACSNLTYKVSGSVSGLRSGDTVTLLNGPGNATSVTANGTFSLGQSVPYNGSYAVTIGTQPIGQLCSVTNGSGAGVVADVTGVAVTCNDITYMVSGVVVGLTAGKQVTLLNNASNATAISANGSFSFNTPIAHGGSYSVTVGAQPVGQACTVTNGSGSGTTANINSVVVNCSDITFALSGTLSGLQSGQVTLLNNGSNATTVSANGVFRFSQPIAFNGSYAVTVGTQPVGQTCAVTNGSGGSVAANISGVLVSCTANRIQLSAIVWENSSSALGGGTDIQVSAGAQSGIANVSVHIQGALIGSLTAPNACPRPVSRCEFVGGPSVFLFRVTAATLRPGSYMAIVSATDKTGFQDQISVPINILP